MAAVVVERVVEVLSREAASLSDAPPLLAKIRLKSANNQSCWAEYTPNGKWELLRDTEDDLDSSRSGLAVAVEVEQIHLVVPGRIQTNCWETAFYLAGLAACEGGSAEGKSADEFIRHQEKAGTLKRVDSINEADLVANGSIVNPTALVHAALRVDYRLVHEYLKTSARVKELCASQLGLSMTTESVTKYAGHVLIERYGASLSEVDSTHYAQGVALNFAIEFGKLREYPMFYSLV